MLLPEEIAVSDLQAGVMRGFRKGSVGQQKSHSHATAWLPTAGWRPHSTACVPLLGMHRSSCSGTTCAAWVAAVPYQDTTQAPKGLCHSSLVRGTVQQHAKPCWQDFLYESFRKNWQGESWRTHIIAPFGLLRHQLLPSRGLNGQAVQVQAQHIVDQRLVRPGVLQSLQAESELGLRIQDLGFAVAYLWTSKAILLCSRGRCTKTVLLAIGPAQHMLPRAFHSASALQGQKHCRCTAIRQCAWA